MYAVAVFLLFQVWSTSAQGTSTCVGSGNGDCIVISAVQRLSSTSVGLAWNTSDNCQPQNYDHFTIEFDNSVDNSTTFIHSALIPVPAVASAPNYQYAYCITNLNDSGYCFRVRLQETIINVAYELHRQPEIFSYLPSQFDYEALSATTIHFTWNNPNLERVVFSCKTPDNFLLPLPSEDGFSLQLNATVSNITIESFKPATPYTCSISAVSSNGSVGASTTLSFTTSPDNVRLNSTTTSVQVSWSATDSSDVIGYIVYVSSSNASQSRIISNSSVDSENVTGLSPYTWVTVQVAAKTTTGAGERSPPVSITTEQGIPGPVRNLQAGGLNERSLAVVWEEPAVTNGVVSYHYSLHSDSIPGHSLQLTTNCTVVHIGNLSSNTEYSVSVQASTAAGNGSRETLFGIYTHESVPGAVEISNISRNGDGAIRVYWDIVQSSDSGRATGYRITVIPLYTCNTLPMEHTTNTTWYQTDDDSLDPTAAYSVRVAAYNPTGLGASDEQFVAPRLIPYNVSGQTNFIRLRLTGVGNCTTWNVQTGAEDIKNELHQRLNLNFSRNSREESENCFQNAEITCPEIDGNRLNFQAVLASTCLQSYAQTLHQNLQHWVSIASPFLIVNGYILTLDKSCPVLYIDSLEANDSCSITVPSCAPCMNVTVSSKSGVAGVAGAAVGALIGGLVLGAVVTVLVVFGILKKRGNSQTKKKKEVAMNEDTVQPDNYKIPSGSDTITGTRKEEHKYDYITTTGFRNAASKPVSKNKKSMTPKKTSLQEVSNAYEDNGGYELPDIAMQSYNDKQQQQQQQGGGGIEIFYDTPETSGTNKQQQQPQQKQQQGGGAIEIFYDTPETSGTEPAPRKKANPVKYPQAQQGRGNNQKPGGQKNRSAQLHGNNSAAQRQTKKPLERLGSCSSSTNTSQQTGIQQTALAIQPMTAQPAAKGKPPATLSIAANPPTQQAVSTKPQLPGDTSSSLSFAEKRALAAAQTQIVKPVVQQPPVQAHTAAAAATATAETGPNRDKKQMKVQRSTSHNLGSMQATKNESDGSEHSPTCHQQPQNSASNPQQIQGADPSQSTKKVPLLPKPKTAMTLPQSSSVFPPSASSSSSSSGGGAGRPRSKPQAVATGASSGGDTQPPHTKPKPMKGGTGNIGLKRNMAYEPMAKKCENVYTFGE